MGEEWGFPLAGPGAPSSNRFGSRKKRELFREEGKKKTKKKKPMKLTFTPNPDGSADAQN